MAELALTGGTLFDGLDPEAEELARGSISPATWAAYKKDCEHYAAWCQRSGSEPRAPESVANYIAGLDLRPSSIRRRLAAIAFAHRVAGELSPCDSPKVRTVFAGIRRSKGVAPRKVDAATVDVVRKMVAAAREDPNEILGLRDVALLLVGFAGCFRRSELVALEVGDLGFPEEGMEAVLRRSKTDQEGEGITKRIPYGSSPATCPVRNLRSWMKSAAIEDGLVFRSVSRHGKVGQSLGSRSVALAVKRRASEAGLDPDDFAGHSLRSGLATSAVAAGASVAAVMRSGGWRSERVALGYVRARDAWEENAAATVGL